MSLKLVKIIGSQNWYIRGTVVGKTVYQSTKTTHEEYAQAILENLERDMLDKYLLEKGIVRQKQTRTDGEPSSKYHLYRHYNSAGELLYVGISYNSMFRLHQHSKSARWFDEISTVKVTHYTSKQAAMNAEVRAIRMHRPKYNIRHAVQS